jgi:very-short-patch-repair endonuclease
MGQTQTATQKVTIGDRLIRSVQGWRRLHRLLFPSPLEAQFVRIMRGHTLTIPFVKSRRTGFPLTFIWRGKLLKRELVKREVRAGSKFIDYAVVTPFYKRGIEIYSSWHMDVVADQQREDYLKARGWKIMYVTSKQMNEPKRLFADVLRFLKQ